MGLIKIMPMLKLSDNRKINKITEKLTKSGINLVIKNNEWKSEHKLN